MIDNQEIEMIMEILENHWDEERAVQLLKEFNLHSSNLGKLLLNLDKNLDHNEWKKSCDLEKEKLDQVIQTIKSLKSQKGNER